VDFWGHELHEIEEREHRERREGQTPSNQSTDELQGRKKGTKIRKRKFGNENKVSRRGKVVPSFMGTGQYSIT
jgi:hypothetical protein